MSVFSQNWVFIKLLFYNILFIISEYILGKCISLEQKNSDFMISSWKDCFSL